MVTAESTDQEESAASTNASATEQGVDLVQTEAVPPDVAFDILSNTRRRLVLYRLAEVGGESTTGDLAEYVASVENQKPQSELTSQERKRVYVGLYQAHLPKMDDANILRVDDRGRVTLGPHANDVFQFLEMPGDNQSPATWPIYYGALTGVSAIMLAIGFLVAESVLPFIFAGTLVLFAILVAVHYRSTSITAATGWSPTISS